MDKKIIEKWIEVDGIDIRYFSSLGKLDAKPVVFLHHGIKGSALSSWEHVLKNLPGHFKFYAPDLPGFGKSEKSKREYTTDFYVRFLEGFLNKLEPNTQVSIVGHSLGGSISLSYYLKNPKKVSKLGLVSSHGLGKNIPFLHKIAYIGFHIPYLEDILWKVYNRFEGVIMEWAFFSWLKNEIKWDEFKTNFLDNFNQICIPVLICHGSKDWIVPSSWASRAHKEIENSNLYMFDGSGHFIPKEYPDRLTRILVNFLGNSEEIS